jgi:aspartyl-tRNA(Asn)/glutamyl-tRNA(Gln) amidotransferase subunit C
MKEKSKIQNQKLKIDKKDVEHIATLARLSLSKKEIEQYQKELSQILEYVEKLNEVDVSNVEPTFHPLGIKNIMRKDEECKKDKNEIKKLLSLMPKMKEGYLEVEKIL